jgi:hypothetical protein
MVTIGNELEIKNKAAAVRENIKLSLSPSGWQRYKILPQREQNALPPGCNAVSRNIKSH